MSKKYLIWIGILCLAPTLFSHAQDISVVRELKQLWKYDEAVAALTRMMEEQGPQPALLEELADCHYQAGNAAQALEQYTRLAELNPGNLIWKIRLMNLLHRNKQYGAAISMGHDILQQDSITQVISLLGDAYNLRGQRDSAKLCYQNALRRRPGSETLVSKLSDLLLSDERYDEVLALTDAFLRHDPDNQTVLPISGIALYGKNLPQEAAPVFRKVLTLGDDSYATHYYLGQCYLKQNFLPLAEQELKAAWQRDSSDVGVAIAIGKVLGDKARQEDKEYADWFAKALKLLAPDQQTLYTTGVAHQYYALAAFRGRDYDMAIEQYGKMLEYSPRHYSAYYMIAQCYEYKQDYKSALSWYKKAQNAFAVGSRGRDIADAGVERMTQEIFMLE